MSEPKLSVVIAAHNAAPTIGDQLDALLAQDWPYPGEIVVADNRSTDGLADMIAARDPGPVPIRLVDAGEMIGAAYARNTGVETAAGEWLAFCDADDVVGDRWITAVTTLLADHDVVSGPLEFDRLNEPWVTGSRGRSLDATHGEIGRFDGIFPIASSCNLAMKRRTFEAIAGFDPAFVKSQDAELSLRLWESSIEIHTSPDMLVHYRLRHDMGAIFRQSRQWGRQRPRIWSRLVEAGVPRPSVRSRLRTWGWLIATAPSIRRRDRRAHWLHVAGARLGTLEGSVAIRRWFP